jgi:acyl-CoA reductase-like NAD-dependent aldehyde dehydrogenase
MEERIAHEPLGVIANISAWNYPYFVGGNVFVPALAAGNAVLYKPSEFATLTGMHIADMLHAAGVPDDVFVPSSATARRHGRAAAARRRRLLHRLVRTGAKIAASRPAHDQDAARARRQGPDLRRRRRRRQGRRRGGRRRRLLQHRAVVLLGRARLRARAIYDAFVDAFVAEVKGFKVGDPLDEATYIGAITRKPQLACCRGRCRREEERRDAS